MRGLLRHQRDASAAPAQPRSPRRIPTSLYNASRGLRKLFAWAWSGLWCSARKEGVAPSPDSPLAEMRRQAGARQPALYVSLLRPKEERQALADVEAAPRLRIVPSAGEERGRG